MIEQPSLTRPTLSLMLGRRILAISSFILIVQIFSCTFENLTDHRHFTTHYINLEVNRIGKALRRESDRLTIDEKAIPAHFLGKHAFSYAFRVTDQSGSVIAATSSQILENALPTIGRGLIGPYTWYRQLESGEWFHVAGGEPYHIGADEVWIEVATLGDPAFQRIWALLSDLTKEVWMPSVPLILMTLGFVLYTVRVALDPVISAAQKVERINAQTLNLGIAHSRLPREISILTSAIDRLLQRNSALLDAQRRLLAHSAHELRTPLSMMLLEVGSLKDDTSVRLAHDVRAMSATVNQLLSLARLDAIDELPAKDVDICEAASRAARSLQTLAAARNCTITLSSCDPEVFPGDATSIYDAVRNLLENALKHTPEGGTVRITCGPGRSVRVEDSGRGFPATPAPETLFEPFVKGDAAADGAGLGLAIVKRSVELHKGSIEVGTSSLGGACVEVNFGGSSSPRGLFAFSSQPQRV